jgi:hypothetical protein
VAFYLLFGLLPHSLEAVEDQVELPAAVRYQEQGHAAGKVVVTV